MCKAEFIVIHSSMREALERGRWRISPCAVNHPHPTHPRRSDITRRLGGLVAIDELIDVKVSDCIDTDEWVRETGSVHARQCFLIGFLACACSSGKVSV